MIRSAIFFLALNLLLACSQAGETEKTEETVAIETPSTSRAKYAIVIHGGAGTILKENMTPEKEEEYTTALNNALDIGEGVLKKGGSSLDAVQKAIIFLENSPLFNAGKGAVFTHEGKNELDASIMDGATRNAGAVGGVTTVKNPILAARAVMEHSRHVLLTGKGAEQFAQEQGLEIVEPQYFFTENRWESLQRAKAAESKETGFLYADPAHKYGTVGCVALDKKGNIAAGTSTGGMTNKRYNRFGDVPVIGAGTYASNATCGVSCTGHGEYFIRYAVAYDISALMEYKGLNLEDATNYVIHEKLKEAGGSGGLIAIDRMGNVAMPFNSAGMYRGYAKPGERVVRIYGEE
ncbi:MAG: isoaspartyl peptidase/L-asparaginase [Phaeodactylibacter sp.]|nr:isoaspartyl peptidase/L-asparaginase [Phaeodactylibacter sp.]MCB9265304.1 isoaspartyl peptidase/L-asparaginase [Lewinellaceae bacterium]MCB9287032.1 isoaspartyl peptidase/L-asparaginase [Lewinellaceae bacterium]